MGKSWKDQETGNNPSGRGKTTEAEPENWIQVGSTLVEMKPRTSQGRGLKSFGGERGGV